MATTDATQLRRAERERVLTLLYQSEIKLQSLEEILSDLDLPESEFVIDSIRGIDRFHDEIYEAISAKSTGWPIERMPAIDRCLLRFATYEILYSQKINTAIAISEAVELAKAFSTAESGRFVNGLLSAIASAPRKDGQVEAPTVGSD